MTAKKASKVKVTWVTTNKDIPHHGYWRDEKGNIWTLIPNTDKNSAEIAARSLIDCYGCWNCDGCQRCSACVACVNCEMCTGCHECERCSGCNACFHSIRCENCLACDGCTDCEDCLCCRDMIASSFATESAGCSRCRCIRYCKNVLDCSYVNNMNEVKGVNKMPDFFIRCGGLQAFDTETGVLKFTYLGTGRTVNRGSLKILMQAVWIAFSKML